MANRTLKLAAQSRLQAYKLAKSMPISELEQAVKNLTAAAAKVKKQHAENALKEREKNLRKIKVMMDKMGLGVQDLTGISSAREASERGGPKTAARRKKTSSLKGKKIAPQYAIEVNGESHKWTGRGRMPLIFKEYIESGGSLEKCSIK